MDLPQTFIPVVVRHSHDPDPELELGAFPPSQINALLGIVRNSTAYSMQEGEEWQFHSWQWYIDRDNIGRPIVLELIFG